MAFDSCLAGTLLKIKGYQIAEALNMKQLAERKPWFWRCVIMFWNETFTHIPHSQPRAPIQHQPAPHREVKPVTMLSWGKRDTHETQYHGELLRWRHRQEMLGRKRDCWVLHWLGGGLQPLDRLEERKSWSVNREALGVGAEIPPEGCHIRSIPPTTPYRSSCLRALQRQEPGTKGKSKPWLDPLGLKILPKE